jgi:hypothetical protein
MGQPALSKTVKAKPDVVAAIKTAHIGNDVPLPEKMFFQGRAQSIGMGVGGAIGGAIADKVSKKEPPDQILEIMREHKIDLPSIIKSEFAKAMQTAGHIVAVDDMAGDVKIDLAVVMYGLGQRQGFSAVLYPVLRVEAKMTRADGMVIWQKEDYITPLNKENSGGHTFEEYVQQPELLRATWTNIAGITSREVLRSLYPAVKGKR